jgi:hypothetical protein
MKKETRAYEMVVEFYNEIEYKRDYIEFVVFAKSMAKAEKKAIKECAGSFIAVHRMEVLEHTPLF